MRTLTRLVGGTAATTAILAAGLAGASAQESTLRDRASDVVRYVGEDDETGTILGYQPSLDTGTDLRSMRVLHGSSSVSITLKFAELDRDGADISVAFRESGQTDISRLLFNTGKKSAVVISLGGSLKCTVPLSVQTGKKGHIYTKITRKCLSNPAKLKASAVVSRMTGTEDAPIDFVDYASSTKFRTPAWTPWLKRG